MSNVRFQTFYGQAHVATPTPPSASPSLSIYAPSELRVAQRTDDIVMSSHEPRHDQSTVPALPALSPLLTSGWTFPMNVQSPVSMYSPASPDSFVSFHSPVEANTRAYALAGALQQPNGAGFPESFQRGAADLARGATSRSPVFPTDAQTAQQASGQHQNQHQHLQNQQNQQQQQHQQHQHQHQQRWPYAYAGLSMPRAPIPAQPAPAVSSVAVPTVAGSDDSGAASSHNPPPPPPSTASARIRPAVFSPGDVSAGGRVSLASDAGAGDQRPRAGLRQQHAATALAQQPAYAHPHPHRAMASQPHSQHLWLPSGHAQDHNQDLQSMLGGTDFLHAPMPRLANQASHAPSPVDFAMRHPYPFAPVALSGVAGVSEADYSADSDDYGEDPDEPLDDEEPYDFRHMQLNVPTASPTPELQFPQGPSGTPSDLMRSNFALYGGDAANWPAESLAGLADPGSGAIGIPVHGHPHPHAHVHTHTQVHAHPHSEAVPHAQGKGKASISITAPDFFGTPGSPEKDKGKRTKSSGPDENDGGQTVKVLVESSTPGEPPKKIKMHQCRICQKLFPRPSGLATHMNSHSGARPFKCPLELCPKTFAVRSNARRHLRTHGITIPPSTLSKGASGRTQDEPFHVGFETPVVIDVHDPSCGTGADGTGAGAGAGHPQRAPRLRWVPPSLAARTNAPRLRSLSPASDMADVDADNMSEFHAATTERATRMRAVTIPTPGTGVPMFSQRSTGLKIAPAPLPPAVPSETVSDINERFDERNSYAEAGTYPYHPNQWRCLPGPGLVVALS